MDIAIEKAMLIERFKLINDQSLINAIKNLLDFGLEKQSENDKELKAAIERGLIQSLNGEVKPHNEVWDKIRKRYQS